jgi:hypothetical protein
MAMVVPLPQSYGPVVDTPRFTLPLPTRQAIVQASARPSTQWILSRQPYAADHDRGRARLHATSHLFAVDQDSEVVDQRRYAFFAAPPGQWSA